MAQKPSISPKDTQQFLESKLNGDVQELTLLKGGDWSQAYSFLHDGKKYVLRWCHSSETFEKDAAASKLSSEAMPVPQVLDTGEAFEEQFAITEFAQGKFFDTLNVDELNQTLPSLLNMLDALRTVDLSRTSGYGGWDKNGVGSQRSWKAHLLNVNGPDDNPERFTYGWYAKLAKSPIGTGIFDRLYPQFEALVDQCPEVRQLIHSDLLNYNLLAEDGHISGVIDWQCSLYGDALYDVAWFTFYQPWYPQFEAIQLSQKLRAHFEASADSTNLRERLVCYQLHIALDSIIYNSAKENWKNAQDAADYAFKIAAG